MMLNDNKDLVFLDTTAFLIILSEKEWQKMMIKYSKTTSCGSGKKYKKCHGKD